MDTIDLFEFETYKPYLQAIAKHKGSRSGFKTALANTARCNLTYISNVLNGNSHLSLEQAESLNPLLCHTPDESEYFLLLIQLERAGTVSLKNHFIKQIDKLRERRLTVRSKLNFKGSLSEEDRTKYYSAWYYAAIHVALSIECLQTISALSEYFKLPRSIVASVIEFLEERKLAIKKGKRFSIGPSIIHLDENADQISMHHANWRSHTIAHLNDIRVANFHYSAAVTLSQADTLQVKNLILEFLKKALTQISVSDEEQVFALNVDFFNLGSTD